MKINFEQVILDLEGAAVKAGPKDLTLKTVCVNALQTLSEEEKNLSGEEKMKRHVIARKVFSGKAELTVDEVSLVKKLVGSMYVPAIVGPAWDLLEGKKPEKTELPN